jgi:hypothetical protein
VVAANIAKLPELLRRSPIIGIRTKTARLKEKGQSLRRDDALPGRAWFCIRGAYCSFKC